MTDTPTDVKDERCRHCQQVIEWRWESEDHGKWRHKQSKSMQCDLWAEPA